MSTMLRVENLPLEWTENDLHRLMNPFGTVLRAAVMVASESPSTGRGYVQMLTPMEAAVAKLHLHRTRLEGVELLVFLEEPAHDKEDL